MQSIKPFFLFTLSLFYIAAGINHFVNLSFYEELMPSYLPAHKLLIHLSGVCEIAFGIIVLFPKTRKIAARLIIAMLLAFLIVHIQMLIDWWGDPSKNIWIPVLRLPFQFVLIWWAYIFTKDKKNPE